MNDWRLELAERIAKGEEIDWREQERRHGDDPGLAKLKLIAAVGSANAQGRVAVDDPGTPQSLDVPFKWGQLEAIEFLGRGGSGEVYRAFDTVLEREVAVKLRRSSSGGDDAFIAEARHLASVRHPNVLAVHGAALHGGRVGLWTDLIFGETLEEALARQGRPRRDASPERRPRLGPDPRRRESLECHAG